MIRFCSGTGQSDGANTSEIGPEEMIEQLVGLGPFDLRLGDDQRHDAVTERPKTVGHRGGK